jgi:REP element-mobilizing transposase RayT
MPYWRLHYHAIWSCKNRAPLITPELEPELYKYLRGKGLELGGIMHAVGGIEDHVHNVFSLPPKYAIADFIGKLKGASSHWAAPVG